jgi:hypothetical protein
MEPVQIILSAHIVTIFHWVSLMLAMPGCRQPEWPRCQTCAWQIPIHVAIEIFQRVKRTVLVLC